MTLSSLLAHWNDILTVLTFLLTSILVFYQIRYYRNQSPSLELVNVTNAEYHDFDKYTKYEFTVRLKNDGRDPIFIPNIELFINGEEIEVNNEERYEKIAPQASGSRFASREFRTIQLGANEFDDVELVGIGESVDTIDPINGEFRMETSIGDVEREVTFQRAP